MTQPKPTDYAAIIRWSSRQRENYFLAPKG